MRKSQLGTVNKKDITRKGGKARRILPPWGRAIPFRNRSTSRVSGSSTRASRPDSSLAPQTKGYPRNKPSQWPVEPDFVNHTLAPPQSGYTSTVAAANNTAVENAYKRAGYQ